MSLLTKQNRKRGYSLLEMMIALALFAGILVIAISTISLSSYSIVNEANIMYASQNATTALHFIVADVKSSGSVFVDDDSIVFYRTNGEAITYRIDDEHNTVYREDDEVITGYRLFQVIPIDDTSFMLSVGMRGAETMQYTFICTGDDIP